jgi:ribosome-binding factor A
MESKRQLQVAELIKRNFGIILQQEGTYVYGAEPLVTVTSVKISPDFNIAKVYLSVFNIEDKQNVILHIEDNYLRLRQMAAQRLRKHMRRIPAFEFFLDDTLDEMYRLKEIFKDLHENNQMGTGTSEQSLTD